MVKPDSQSKGIGTRLMQAIEGHRCPNGSRHLSWSYEDIIPCSSFLMGMFVVIVWQNTDNSAGAVIENKTGNFTLNLNGTNLFKEYALCISRL